MILASLIKVDFLLVCVSKSHCFWGEEDFWVRYRNKGTIFVEDFCWVKKPPETAKGKMNRKKLFVHVFYEGTHSLDMTGDRKKEHL